MKQNTTPTLRIQHTGLDLEDVDHITYVFKSINHQCSPEIIRKVVSHPPSNEHSVVEVSFTDEETYLFPPGTVYVDAEIVLLNGAKPAAEKAEIEVTESLFRPDEDGGEAE